MGVARFIHRRRHPSFHCITPLPIPPSAGCGLARFRPLLRVTKPRQAGVWLGGGSRPSSPLDESVPNQREGVGTRIFQLSVFTKIALAALGAAPRRLPCFVSTLEAQRRDRCVLFCPCYLPVMSCYLVRASSIFHRFSNPVRASPCIFPCSLQESFRGGRRIGVTAAVEVLDLVARGAVSAADAGKIARSDRRFAVAAGDVEHVSGLA